MFFFSPNNSCFTAIYPNTTFEDVHPELQRRHTLPKGEGFCPYFFTTFSLYSQLLSWNESISSASIKCLRHIQLHLLLPGGLSNDKSSLCFNLMLYPNCSLFPLDEPSPLSKLCQLTCARHIDHLAEAIAAEGLWKVINIKVYYHKPLER
jgi:hypothetical protein